MDLSDRFAGAILGLAIGDALGAPVEFKPRGSFRPVTGMRGGGPFGLEAGYWTDDTSMALCLAESLIECEYDPADQIRRYLGWYRDGHLSSTGTCFDIGNTTRDALTRFEREGDVYAGSTHVNSSGNGSLMRLVPVPLFYVRSPEQAVEASGDSSRTTHGSQICVDACRYFGGLLVGAARGATRDELLRSRYHPAHGSWPAGTLHATIDEIAAGSFRRKTADDIRGSGYAPESLEAALWCFSSTDTFAEAVLAAVNLGEDTDTTAAICGQLAGTYYGARAIPEEWLNTIAHRELLDGFAGALFQSANA
jgi:ADP-ribosylglycohydrolase